MEEETGWLTKDEAKRVSGFSDSTLERRVKEGALRREYRAVPGRKHEVIFAQADLDKLTKPKQPLVLKTKPRARRHLTIAADQNGITPSDHQAVVPSVPLHLKLFLTLPEAVAYSGLPRVVLEEKIAAKELHVLKRGKNFVSRKELEALTIFDDEMMR